MYDESVVCYVIKNFVLVNKWMISEVLMAVTMKATTVFWDVTWCGLQEIYQHLRKLTGVASKVLQTMKYFYQSMWHCIPQDSNVYFSLTAQHMGHLRQSTKWYKDSHMICYYGETPFKTSKIRVPEQSNTQNVNKQFSKRDCYWLGISETNVKWRQNIKLSNINGSFTLVFI